VKRVIVKPCQNAARLSNAPYAPGTMIGHEH
jgi:hypothetical protein